MSLHCSSLCLFLVALIATESLLLGATAQAAREVGSDQLPGIHNFFRATTNVFSGSQPEGNAGFESLAGLGVKTVVSVDGAKPDVTLAAKYGLRYVHLPIGYGGISRNRMVELIRAATALPGPIYVHCHHGKHRGPAAVSVVCMADAGWSAAQAEEFMHKAGTGAEYQRLYRAVREFTAPTAAQLASVSTNFPSVVKTSSLVDAMVEVDKIYENLKRVQAAGWQTPTSHPDISPEHEALMLQEQFNEIERMPEVARHPPDFLAKLHDSKMVSQALRQRLEGPELNQKEAAFNAVGQSCAECHRRYRNN